MHALAPAAALLWLAAGPALAGVLEITNTDRCRVWRQELPPDGRFAITYHHSIYDQPVTEDYEAAGKVFVLRRLESPSAAVLEYFGVTRPGTVHERAETLRRLVQRIAMGEPQRLSLNGQTHSLLDYGRPGDRLELRAVEGGMPGTHACPGR